MKKRLIALALCLVMLATCLGAGMLAPTPVTLVDENGAAATSAAVPQLGRKTLKASYADATETTGYQWQFSNDGDTWIDIYGETAQTCSLSYAKVKNMLDADGKAQLRCVVTDGEDERVSSAATVTVDYSAQTAEAATEAQSGVSVMAAPARAASYTLSAEPQSDDAPTPSTYNIVINYVFGNGEIAADPYTASIAAGSDFNATVTFPTVQGYLPYVGITQQNSLELDIKNINDNITYNVVYKPTNVNYTVIHYKQNLDDDNYTEAARENKQGLTNSTVPEVAHVYTKADKTLQVDEGYEGFYALLYEKPAIAADGSTVVEIYYDRYYYLMNFDLDGGYGVEPIYARYGAPISVGTPTKAGYTFGGWSLDGTNTVTLPTTMPAKNSAYTALWTVEGKAKVTIVVWGENADNEEYSYIKSQQINVKPGTEFTYNENGSLICALEVHTHKDDCYSLTCTKEVHTHSESCNTCGKTEHTTHTTTCYAGVGNKQDVYTDVPNNPKNGQVTNHWLYGKLIYINRSWYRYSGTTADGEIAPTTCHKHSEACLGCGKTEHTHSIENGCYTLTCGKTEHTHTPDCYMSGAGLDSNLWTFVKSDTVTVAADGSSVVNVYYDRVEKTLTFKYNYSDRNGYQSTETITAKWGADISTQYKAIATNAKSTFWSADTSYEEPYTNYFGIMPQTSATYYNRGAAGDEGTMTYLGQDLNGNYTVKLFEVTGVGGYYVSDEDRYEFEGFTYHHGTSNDSSCSGAKFYYTRNSYTLTFNDGYNDVKSENVLYEAPLSTYSSYVPAAPSAYESGSVTFGGWYLNPECTGAEYKLDDHTMPADNVLLYAKWVPVTRTVEFYLDKAAWENGTKLSTHPDISVPHGSLATPAPKTPENGSYTFIGWFYMENGVEKAFDFANMPVKKDMQVYGKWSSNVLKQYTIYYKYKDAEGNEIEIADPTTGSGLAGVTKTFEAKGGTDLYAKYQEGYFPVTKSHSLTLDINATEENDTNVYTFWYVQKDAVPYTVKYLNKETGASVATEKTVSKNRKAVVTETFEPVSGMMPDAYQKRLVVSAEEGAVNEIIFYYTKDTTHAYYKITHYTENLGTDADGNPTWTEYASSQAVGDIGTTCNAEPMTIPGFTYDSTVAGTVASGKLTASGLELKLYYTRNSYPYQVRYLEQGTGNQLAEPKDGTGKYGEVVSESAVGIANYAAVDPTSQTLNIRIEEDNEAKLNIITFYYKEKEVTINYVVVGPDGCGTVSPTSETLKVLTGTAKGSTAAASSDTYRFVGWYDNEACTGTALSTKATYVPQKGSNGIYSAATYYAKFEYNLTDLTITKTITGYESELYGSQDFVFNVKSQDGSVDIDVVLNVPAGKTTGSVTIKGLTVGETYTITENTGWSWRYELQGVATPTGATGTVVYETGSSSATYTPNGINNEIVFTNNWVQAKWLSFTDSVKNIFGKPNT